MKIKTMAIIPHGDTFEEFFDTINMSFDKLCNEVNNGWLFGYVLAMRAIEPNTKFIFIFFSSKVDRPYMQLHKGTNSPVYLLPTTKVYRAFKKLKDRNKRTSEFTTVTTNDTTVMTAVKSSEVRKAGRALATYLSTNVGELEKLLVEHKVDSMLVQEYEYGRFDVCVWLGKKLGISTFASYQGGNERLSVIEKFPRQWAMKNCTGLVIAASVERNRVLNSYNLPESKVGYIFNPTEVDEWVAFDKEQSRLELGLPLHSQIAIWHGRVMMHIKGLDTLTSAWKEVNKNGDKYLVVIGSGKDDDQLEQVIKDLELKNVIRLGFTTNRTQLVKYLSAADVYLFPSRHEGFALAPLEAISCSLPVVATDCPGICDVFPNKLNIDGGTVVPIADTEAFVHATNHMFGLEPHELKTVSLLARQRAVTGFSLPVIGKQLLNFLFP